MNDTPAGCAHRVGFASVARRIYAADLSAGFWDALGARWGGARCTARARERYGVRRVGHV